MDYTTLVGAKSTPGSIASWINNSQIQSSAPMVVQEAEAFIYRRLRHWKMLVAPVTGTLTIGVDSIALPSDLLEPDLLYITGTYFQEIEQRAMQEVVANYQYDGNGNRVNQQPLMYFFNQSNMQFDSPPDQAYSYSLTYYQQPAALSGSLTNFLTTTYPRLLRAVCMMGAAEWAKDAGMGNYDRTYWEQVAELEIQKAQEESDRARRATKAGAVMVGGGGVGFPAYVY